MNISIAGVGRRDEIRVGNTLRLPDAFVVGKKERTVLNDRAANRAPELIPLEGRLRSSGIFKEIPGIESAVTQKFINAPVKVIRARRRVSTTLRHMITEFIEL